MRNKGHKFRFVVLELVVRSGGTAWNYLRNIFEYVAGLFTFDFSGTPFTPAYLLNWKQDTLNEEFW